MIITEKPTNIKHTTDYEQWVAWRYRDKRKIPINPHTHKSAKPTDPATWSSYENALQAAQEGEHSGVGFVFSSHDPFTGIDLDDCIDAETGEVSAQALEIVERLDSYTEVSPSGTGLKIWVRGEKPGTRCKNTAENVEIYDRNRFFTFTGDVIRDVEIADRQHELNQLYRETFPANTSHTGAAATPVGPDEKLLQVARNERGGEFKRLYDRGESNYGSASSADYRLCVKLVFYFGDDPARIERLFSSSALGQRDKWRNRQDYRQRTIANAIAATSARYNPTPEPRIDVSGLREYASTAVWPGRGGPVDRAVYESLLDTVVGWGKQHPEGFTVCASVRDVAAGAGCDFKSAHRALRDLESKHQLIKRIKDSEGGNAATYLVRTELRKPHHISTSTTTPVFNMMTLAHFLRNAPSPRKETISAREPGRTVSVIIESPYLEESIGKLAGAVLVKLVEMGGDAIKLKDLAKSIGKRSNDLKRRQLPVLVKHGFITCDDGLISVAEDVESRLEEHLHTSGCYERAELQAEKHERQREAYRTRDERPADPAPTEDEMAAQRKLSQAANEAAQKIREERERAEGYIEELERHNKTFNTFEPDDTPQLPIPAARNYPAQVDGIYVHGSACECWLCDDDYVAASREGVAA